MSEIRSDRSDSVQRSAMIVVVIETKRTKRRRTHAVEKRVTPAMFFLDMGYIEWLNNGYATEFCQTFELFENNWKAR